jgi:hypothetical protein
MIISVGVAPFQQLSTEMVGSCFAETGSHAPKGA